jgi:hypothetical protein
MNGPIERVGALGPQIKGFRLNWISVHRSTILISKFVIILTWLIDTAQGMAYRLSIKMGENSSYLLIHLISLLMDMTQILSKRNDRIR